MSPPRRPSGTPGGASLEERWRASPLTGATSSSPDSASASWRAGAPCSGSKTPRPRRSALLRRHPRRRRPGHYYEVLHDLANISVSLVQMEDLVEVDRALFLPMPRLNRFTMLRKREDVAAIERDYGVRLPVRRRPRRRHAPSRSRLARSGRARHQALSELPPSYGLRRAHRRQKLRPDLRSPPGRPLPRSQYEERPRPGGLPRLRRRAAPDAAGSPSSSTSARAPASTAASRVPRWRQWPPSSAPTATPASISLTPATPTSPKRACSRRPVPTSTSTCPGSRSTRLRGLSALPYVSGSEWCPGTRFSGFGDDLYWVDTIFGHLIMARQNVAEEVLAELIEQHRLTNRPPIHRARPLPRQPSGPVRPER